MSLKKPLVLTILDGWGYRAEQFANAIALARKPNYDKLLAEYPHNLLHASDHFVGLPDGQMGNSEVGHLNIGSGRVVHMDITRIDDLIRSGEFFRHPVIVQALKHAGEKGRALHLLGLVSDGGVHSQQAHLHALLEAAKQHGVERVFVHAFLDGRDTLPTGGVGYLEKLQQKMREVGVGKIASVGGRYFAMDRDRRWERAKKAFDVIVGNAAESAAYSDPVARVKECYHNGVTDEFVEPFVVIDEQGQPVGRLSDEDACICFNYRADRVRQITRVLARNSGLTKDAGKTLPGAEDLDRAIPPAEVPKKLHYVCMTQYDKQFSLPMVILPESMENLLADMLAQANLRNLRIAETEKYAHVTYFFNGGIEKPFPGEDRVLVPSQKVATYDLAPEMSASGIADAVIKAIGDPAFDLGFSLTHLLSKAHHLRARRREFASAALAYWRVYSESLGARAGAADLEPRAVRHTLACLLARTVGRSPLEYLDPVERVRQRDAVLRIMPHAPEKVADLISQFEEQLCLSSSV